MIRRHVTPFRAIMGLAVALAAAAGLLVATGPAAHGAVVAPHTVARVVGPAYLRDGNGTGKAASAVPGHPPSPGNNVDTFGAGAWKTQWNGDGTICLSSAPHLCFADNSGLVKFRTHDATHADQIWILIGGSEIKNESSGNFLCATGGNDFVVITASLDNCSSYHSSWAFASTAARTMSVSSYSAAAGLAHGCQHVLFTAGNANRPAVVCYALKLPAPGNEWNLVFDGTTSFTVHRGSVIEGFQFTPSRKTTVNS